MDYIIAIPSKDRPDNQKTLTKFLKDYPKERIFIFVEPDEHNEYVNKWQNLATIINIQQLDKGIGYSRNFIQKWANTNGYRHVILLDDAMEEFHVRSSEKTAAGYFKLNKVENFKAMFDECMELMVNKGYAQLGLTQKFFNWYTNAEIVENRGCATCVILDVKMLCDNNVYYDETLYSGEDVDLSVQLLKAGLTNAIYYKYAIGKKVGDITIKGGCHDFYKKVEDTKKVAEYVAKKHPGIVLAVYNEGLGFWVLKTYWNKIQKVHNWW